jgi:hypothetical protein
MVYLVLIQKVTIENLKLMCNTLFDCTELPYQIFLNKVREDVKVISPHNF